MTDSVYSGKTVFITGGGRRAGLHLVNHFLGKGWNVIAHYHSENNYDGRHGEERYASFQASLGSSDDTARLADQVKAHIADTGWTLDAMVHNASCFYPDAESGDSWDSLMEMMSVHVAAPKLLSLSLAPLIRKGGSVISITDIYSDIPNERFASYCSAKAALQNLSLSLSQRLAPSVRVNIIQPGPVQFLPHHDEAYRKKVLSQSLLREELGYTAIAEAVEYLASAEAVTGSVLRVDGGRFVANRYEQTFDVL